MAVKALKPRYCSQSLKKTPLFKGNIIINGSISVTVYSCIMQCADSGFIQFLGPDFLGFVRVSNFFLL